MKRVLAVSLLVLTSQILVKSQEVTFDDDEMDEFWANHLESPRRRLFDIGVVAAYVGILATAGSWLSPNYGGQIKIENYLCHDLIYNGRYVLTHGSWKSHCNVVQGGTSDGCTVTGNWNIGAEGMMQFEVADTGHALS